ncbi:MAG: class I SAM-dependent methyltransferase [Flavobacteriales bacterium]|nr:class I SAM-dependent methyltransferase [Flavobacteriales bacterium]
MSTEPETFPDHFSDVASAYAAHRPHYPAELFAWLASIPPGRALALDTGTGSGQAALGLAAHFDRVVATDASAEQVAHAVRHPRITYKVALAHATGMEPGSVDLVTAATAAHWFDHAAFHAEVSRVLRPRGVLAVWSYGYAHISPDVDRVLQAIFEHVAPFWPIERSHIDSGYRDLPFPFADLDDAPKFLCRMNWTADQMLAYLGTWSAVRQARKALDSDPLVEHASALQAAWGDSPREVVWPLMMRVGRME